MPCPPSYCQHELSTTLLAWMKRTFLDCDQRRITCSVTPRAPPRMTSRPGGLAIVPGRANPREVLMQHCIEWVAQRRVDAPRPTSRRGSDRALPDGMTARALRHDRPPGECQEPDPWRPGSAGLCFRPRSARSGRRRAQAGRKTCNRLAPEPPVPLASACVSRPGVAPTRAGRAGSAAVSAMPLVPMAGRRVAVHADAGEMPRSQPRW
jgi:hypothetical protein